MALQPIPASDIAEPDWESIFNDPLEILAAREHWGFITREMREAGTLAPVNAHQIQRLVIAMVMHDAAAKVVAEQQPVIKAARTGTPQHNPWWSVMKQAGEIASSLEAELGISPRRRNAAGKAQKAKRGASASERYLKRA